MVRKGRCSQLELRRPVLHRLGLGLSCTRTRQHVSPVVPTPRRCAPHVAIAGHVISSRGRPRGTMHLPVMVSLAEPGHHLLAESEERSTQQAGLFNALN